MPIQNRMDFILIAGVKSIAVFFSGAYRLDPKLQFPVIVFQELLHISLRMIIVHFLLLFQNFHHVQIIIHSPIGASIILICLFVLLFCCRYLCPCIPGRFFRCHSCPQHCRVHILQILLHKGVSHISINLKQLKQGKCHPDNPQKRMCDNFFARSLT